MAWVPIPSIPNEFLFFRRFFSLYKEKKRQKVAIPRQPRYTVPKKGGQGHGADRERLGRAAGGGV